MYFDKHGRPNPNQGYELPGDDSGVVQDGEYVRFHILARDAAPPPSLFLRDQSADDAKVTADAAYQRSVDALNAWRVGDRRAVPTEDSPIRISDTTSMADAARLVDEAWNKANADLNAWRR